MSEFVEILINEFESDLNRIIIDIPFLKTIIAFSKHAKGLELFGRWIG